MSYDAAVATYVIGDVQGCFITLERLVARIEFDPALDRLWFVGDLVNRGPSSLDVLRFVRGLGDRARVVLGNHDLHLIAQSRGRRERKRRDTFDDVLDAPDNEELIEWLVGQPLFHRENTHVMVHAGLLPGWSLEEAEALARKAEKRLRDERLRRMGRRLQRAIDALTRLRTCTPAGEMCLEYTGPPEDAPPGCRPWFELAEIPDEVTIFFGHWSSLGLYLGNNAIGLDTGCVWGGALTAMRVEDRKLFHEPSELRS
jgi:bis(5'-nucleosyl)-tetraphosphatase (symmetrical)